MGIHAFLFFAVAISGQVTAYSDYPKGPRCGALLTNAQVVSQFSGSPSLNSSFNESHAFINSSNAWCSKVLDETQHLTLSFDEPFIIYGFKMQGRSSSDQYVTNLKIYFYPTREGLAQYLPSNANPKIFVSSAMNGDDMIYFSLNGTKMQKIVFIPAQWNGHICMRLEVYGCGKVDGHYTAWSDWTPCSNSCGNGTSVRNRSCSDPVPANGGENCTGESFQMKECVGVSCPASPTPPVTTIPTTLTSSQPDSTVDSNAAGKGKSGDAEDENKYFIPMLVLAVVLAFFIVIAVAVIVLLCHRSKQDRNYSKRYTSNETMGSVTVITSC